MSVMGTSSATLELKDIHVRRDDTSVIGSISCRVEDDQHWVILGANGSGKTTLMRIMALYDHPTSGTVDVLGERLGQVDIRVLRQRVGYAAAALADQLRRELTARDVVMTARYAALEPWWHQYTDEDQSRAQFCLGELGVGHLADRSFGTLSSGEQQRVLLARTTMNDPALILLDEPSARLDLGGREELLATLAEIIRRPTGPPIVMVTHHVAEIPQSITHAMLLQRGDVLTGGPIDETLTAASLSECFGLSLELERRHNGRFNAWASQ